MAAIFISHSSRDQNLCTDLKTWLAKEGYEQVFLDFDKHTGLQAGVNWERQLYEEIERCHAVILALTPNWQDSKWCFVEFAQARALGKVLFPVTLTNFGSERVAPEIQGVDLSTWNLDGQEQLRRLIREVVDETARGFHWDKSRSPYPGLYSFEPDDAAIFFGRDSEIREIVERLEARRIQGGKRLFLILGTSGSGKSSVLKAGVLPQADRSPRSWIVLRTFRPERGPFTNFVKALAERVGDTVQWRELRQRLAGPEAANTLASIADDLRVEQQSSSTILISIDQFEELFTVASADEQQSFLSLLNVLSDQELRLPYLTVATARSDVLADMLRSPQSSLSFENYTLRPMATERLPSIIEGPARVAALSIENGLSARISRDVPSTEALPLLAFTLRELYESSSQERRLTIAEYESIGDQGAGLNPIANVVRRKAEDVLRVIQPSAVELAAFKQAFVVGLVRVRDESTFVRQPAYLSRLPNDAHRLIASFVEARLLSKRASDSEIGEIIVEVCHEALLTAWPLLRDWLNDERGFLAGKTQLASALVQYQGVPSSQKKEALLQGLALRRARQWVATHRYGLSKEELAFIEASSRQANQRLLAAWALGSAVVLSGIALAVPPIYAEYGRRTALACDLYAAEHDNNVNVPGVEFDRIVTSAAIPECEAAVATQGENPRLMHNLARAFDKAGRYKEAALWYQKAANLGWTWSQNNLGVLYLYGRGVPMDFAKGVSLFKTAAEESGSGSTEATQQAAINFAGTDYTGLIQDDWSRVGILRDALRLKGFTVGDAGQGWTEALVLALESFKKSAHLDERGITLRVLDRLGVVDRLSTVLRPINNKATQANK